MKKALQISIAKTLFTIEEDAYTKLDHYLTSVRNHFKDTEGKDEILNDIEARIAEQLIEGGEKIVTLTQVEKILGSMGEVKDFGDTEAGTENVSTNTKKLYRNGEDTVIAGVCSGLGAYLGIDTTWIRVGFALSVLLSGFGVLLYIVLWIIVPEAKTKAQRLEMQGEPVNLGTLAEQFGKTVEERVEEVKRRDGIFKRLITLPFRILGKFIKVLGPVIRIIFGVMLVGGALFALFGITMGAGFFASGNILVSNDMTLAALLPGALRIVVLIGLTLALLIPALFILLSGITVIGKKRVITSTLGFGMLGIWFISLIISGFGIAKIVNAHEEFVRTSPSYQLTERTVPLDGEFTKAKITDGISLVIVKGETPSLTAKGRGRDIENIQTRLEEGVLVIEDRREGLDRFCLFCFNSHPDLILTVPSLSALSVEHGSRASLQDNEIDQLKGTAFELNVRHGSSVNLDLAMDSLMATVQHGSRMTLTGVVKNMDVNIQHGSSIDTRELAAEAVKVTATHGSRAEVSASKTLNVNASNGSSVTYLGEPTLTEKTSNGSRVRAENSEEFQFPR